jgi:mercuric ion binding protein
VTVKRAMEGVDGVRARGIDFEPRTATFVFDDTATNANAIAAASADAGYPARIGG